MASAFLNALPSSRVFVLNNDEFTISLRSHLRMRILDFLEVPQDTPCPCNTTHAFGMKPVICSEAHILGCGYAYASTIRHELLKHATVRMATAAGFSVQVEPRLGLAPLMGAKNRGDLSFKGLHSEDKETMIDVSLRNALKEDFIKAKKQDPFHAVNEGHNDKIEQSKQFVMAATTEFVPAIVDSLGVIHPRFMGLINAMSHFTNHQPPEDCSYVTPNFSSYFTQAISITIRRAIARHVMTLAREIRHRLHAGAREADNARSRWSAQPPTSHVGGPVSA